MDVEELTEIATTAFLESMAKSPGNQYARITKVTMFADDRTGQVTSVAANGSEYTFDFVAAMRAATLAIRDALANQINAARDDGAVEAHQLWQSGVLPAKPLRR